MSLFRFWGVWFIPRPDLLHKQLEIILLLIIIYIQIQYHIIMHNQTLMYCSPFLQAVIPTETVSFSSTASLAWSEPKCRWTTRINPCTDFRWRRQTTDIRPNRRFACSGSRCSTWTTTDPRSPVPVSCFRYGIVLSHSITIKYNIICYVCCWYRYKSSSPILNVNACIIYGGQIRIRPTANSLRARAAQRCSAASK